MQLLVRNDISDYATWKSAFDDAAEARGEAGLSVLQIWREAGQPGRVWYLCEVSDAARARAWLDTGRAGLQEDRAGVTGSEAHFLETA